MSAVCQLDRAEQAAGPATSAMPRKGWLAVKMSPIALGPIPQVVVVPFVG
jgi:hypothetical protein